MLTWFPIIYYFLIFLPVALFFIFLFYLYIFERKELFWKFFYLLTGWVLSLFLLFTYSVDLFLFFINGLQETLVVTDPAIFLNLFFYFSFYLSLFFFIPYFIFLIFTYFSSSLYKIEYSYWVLLISLIWYFALILFWIVDQDLFLSSWYSFSFLNNSFFDFQPDFEKFLYSFWADYFDLVIFFSFYLSFYFLLLKGYFHSVLFNWKFRLILFLFYFGGLYYFFGETTIVSDLLLLILSYFLFEVHGILAFFLYELRRLK